MKNIFNGEQEVYRQIAKAIKEYIRLGVYQVGDSLPSCRKLALELKVNPNTVQKAYESLMDEDIVNAIPKKGYYVKQTTNEIDVEDAIRLLKEIKKLNITRDMIINLITELWEEEDA